MVGVQVEPATTSASWELPLRKRSGSSSGYSSCPEEQQVMALPAQPLKPIEQIKEVSSSKSQDSNQILLSRKESGHVAVAEAEGSPDDLNAQDNALYVLMSIEDQQELQHLRRQNQFLLSLLRKVTTRVISSRQNAASTASVAMAAAPISERSDVGDVNLSWMASPPPSSNASMSVPSEQLRALEMALEDLKSQHEHAMQLKHSEVEELKQKLGREWRWDEPQHTFVNAVTSERLPTPKKSGKPVPLSLSSTTSSMPKSAYDRKLARMMLSISDSLEGNRKYLAAISEYEKLLAPQDTAASSTQRVAHARPRAAVHKTTTSTRTSTTPDLFGERSLH